MIGFEWECDLAVSSIVIKWKLPSATSWTSTTVTASGVSGTVSHVIGSNALSNESSYDVHITVSDSSGSSYTTGTLTSMKFVIDALNGGRGIAFGKTAELEGVAEFEFEGKFNLPVYGKALGMDRLPAIPTGSDLNNYIEPGCYAIQSNTIAAACSNIPVARAGRLEVWSSTGEGVRSEQWSYLRQRYIPYNNANAVWERDISRAEDNVWNYGSWWKSSLTPTASDKVYHEQNVLWSGAYFMNGSQTITLSEAISAQPNGIELVFSEYYDGAYSNTAFHTFSISKYVVSKHGGVGHCIQLSTSNLAYFATKYLYISDTKIVGHANNELTGSSTCGITRTCNRFVLRYVIGV